MIIWKATLVFGCLLISSARAQRRKPKCPSIPGREAEPCSYIDEIGDAQSIDNDRKACKDQKTHCCWDENASKCRIKLQGIGVSKGVVEENPFTVPNSTKVDEKIQSTVAARFLGLNPLCAMKEPPVFPSSCVFEQNEPFLLDPPTEVPYCVRIPCSVDTFEQSKLDKTHFDCGSTPGCYFDVELYEYREAFSPDILAGVPVCHSAIRNSVFLREANKVRSELGSWSPYFTNCLLNTFRDEIMAGPPGCALIPLLTTFNFWPKLAGWEGITTKECAYINGCWSNSYGCQYPVDINNIIVKSGQRFNFDELDVVYGRPKCQHFNMDNPYETLKSYHRCLASGCAVDVTISAYYYHYLFDIGDQMSVRDHWYFWASVLKSEIGSFNVDTNIYWNYDKTFSRSLETDTADETTTAMPTTNPSNPFRFPMPGRRKRQAIFGTSKACGIDFRYTYRPCRPVTPPNFRVNTHCPYKPFFVPRFRPLKGTFTGCCEINHCYISRQDIRENHSGPSYYYTQWGTWQDCSIPCGIGGTQKRERKCVTHDKDLCEDKVEETQYCGGQCNKWSRWGPWIPPCDPRTQCTKTTRTRKCEPDPKGCEGLDGSAEESKFCNCGSNPWG